MKKNVKLINIFLLNINKSYFKKTYSPIFYKTFKTEVNVTLNNMLPHVPEIGDSIFKSSYEMVIVYIAWFKVMKQRDFSTQDANHMIWTVSENALKKIPKKLLPFAKNFYLKPILKKADKQTHQSKASSLPEYDWNIEYKKIDDNSFYINIYDCGVKKLCTFFNVPDMLPSLCRMDYLTSHYLQCGFERNLTLGDGDTMCNNKFFIKGTCEWSPEKGFYDRK